MILNIDLLYILITDWNKIFVLHKQTHNENLNNFLSTPVKNNLSENSLIYLNPINLNLSSTLNSTLLGFSNIKEKEKVLSKNYSINFNVLDFFSIGETLHSKLLGFFLQKKASHGQGDLFLKTLLEKLDFNYEEGSKWNVTIESQRIDILMWREYPHSVVIIENKSNDAHDQENQIYRYWHKTIYDKNKNSPSKYSDSRYYKIIYLVASDGKIPSEHSLKRPKGWSSKLPPRIPAELNPEVWFFKKEISMIFEQCLLEIPNENFRLKEYVKQYIEYWQ